MGRDTNMGREELKKGSRQGDSNMSKRTFSFHFSSSFNYVIDWIIATYAFRLASSY